MKAKVKYVPGTLKGAEKRLKHKSRKPLKEELGRCEGLCIWAV